MKQLEGLYDLLCHGWRLFWTGLGQFLGLLIVFTILMSDGWEHAKEAFNEVF